MLSVFIPPAAARGTACVTQMWSSSFTTQIPSSSWPLQSSSSIRTCTAPTSSLTGRWCWRTSFAIWEVRVLLCFFCPLCCSKSYWGEGSKNLVELPFARAAASFCDHGGGCFEASCRLPGKGQISALSSTESCPAFSEINHFSLRDGFIVLMDFSV